MGFLRTVFKNFDQVLAFLLVINQLRKLENLKCL